MKKVKVWLGVEIQVPWSTLKLDNLGGDHITLRHYGTMDPTEAHDNLLPELISSVQSCIMEGRVNEAVGRRPLIHVEDSLSVELTGMGTFWHGRGPEIRSTPILLVKDWRGDLEAMRTFMPGASKPEFGYLPHITLTEDDPMASLSFPRYVRPTRVTIPWGRVFLSINKERIYGA